MVIYLLKMIALVLIVFASIFYFDWLLNKEEIRIEREWQNLQKTFGKEQE